MSQESSPQNNQGTPKSLQDLQNFSVGKIGTKIETPDGFENYPKDLQQEFINAHWKHLENPQSPENGPQPVKLPETLIAEPVIPEVPATDSVSINDVPEKKVDLDNVEPKPEASVEPKAEEPIPTPEAIPPVLEQKLEETPVSEKVPEPTPAAPAAPAAPEPAPATPEATPAAQENVPEWNKDEDLKDLKDLRLKYIKSELSSSKNNLNIITQSTSAENAEADKKEYEAKRQTIAEKIKESLRLEKGIGPLTPDQEKELKTKANEIIFDELVKKENDEYVAALRSNREETLVDKALEGAKNILSNKALDWYRKQNQAVRLGINVSIYTAIAGVGAYLGTGTAATVGMGAAYRLVRGASSFGGAYVGKEIGNLGIGIKNEKGDKWVMKPEEIDKLEKEETEKIKSSTDSLEKKSERLKTLNEKIAKERRYSNIYKTILTVGLGAGAGVAAGGIFNSYYGTGAGIEHVKTGASEQTPPPKMGIPDQTPKASANTIPPEIQKQLNIQENAAKVASSKIAAEAITKPSVAAHADIESNAAQTTSLNNLFPNQEVIQHIEHGDSLWKATGRALEGNKQFSGLNDAQKQNVISYFTNKAIGNPTKYGLTPDSQYGVKVEVGKDLDLHKLFDNPNEISKHLSIAEKLTTGQQSQMLDRSDKIAEWFKQHPHTSLTNDKVSEIMDTKPKVAEVVPGKPEVPAGHVSQVTAESAPPAAGTHFDKYGGVVEDDNLKTLGQVVPAPIPKVPEEVIVSKAPVPHVSEQQLENEITDAKQKLQTLEGPKPPVRSMMGDVSAHQNLSQNAVEAAFKSEINSIYGKSGFLGFGKISGVNTREWIDMSKLPANKVLEYYTHDAASSGLAPDVVEKLSKASALNNKLMEQVVGLMKQTNGTVKPFENEDMEQFIKRLGGYIMRNVPAKK